MKINLVECLLPPPSSMRVAKPEVLSHRAENPLLLPQNCKGTL